MSFRIIYTYVLRLRSILFAERIFGEYESIDCLDVSWHEVSHGRVEVGMCFALFKHLDDVAYEYEFLLRLVHLYQVLQRISVHVNGMLH